MTCHDARERFSALVDDALSTAERRAVDAHLLGCPDCRAELERLEATVALLHRVEPPRAPAGFVDRVLAARRGASWRSRVLRRLFVPLPVKLPLEAAALVLVALAAVYVLRETPELRQAARLEPPPVTTPAPAESPQATEGREAAPGPAANPKDAKRDRGRPRPPVPASKTEVPAAPAEKALDEVKKRAGVGAVAGRLDVSDREAADRALAELVGRLGGTLSRRAEADATFVEVTVPRAAYPDFVRELARLGHWRAEREPAELPEPVTVTLRIAD